MPNSQIKLVNTSSGKLIPAAPNDAVLLTSANLGWRGFDVELHKFASTEIPEHQIKCHRLMIQVGKPVLFEWKTGGRLRRKQLNTGDFSLQTNGELNAPRWTGDLKIIAVALEPDFIERIFQDALVREKIAFQERRCESDANVARFAAHFKDELENATFAGILYGESLAMALSLHLLEKYVSFSPNLKMPRGKLASANLRRALEFIHANLAEDLSIEDIARESYLSAFHFARLFKNTLGLTTHQYVLQNRIERAKNLIVKFSHLNLTEIGLSVGFFDQAHFTKSFKRATGATPKAFLKHAA